MSSKHRILVVEDHVINQEVIKEMLDRMQFDAVMVGSGHEAIIQFTNQQYDLILLDVQLPGMDGYEVTKTIRNEESKSSRNKHIPIVALTANAQKGEREKCLQAGMDDYLTKPFELKDLETIIARHLPK